MRDTLLAAVVGAAIVASILMVVRPSSNGATAQTKVGYSVEQAKCVLRYLEKATTDKAVGMLFNACKTLHK